MSEKITFAQWVAEREAANESKNDLSARLGIAVASLYRYLALERVPDRATMQKILHLSDNRVDVACFYAEATSDGERAA